MGDNNIKSELDRVLGKTFNIDPRTAALLGDAIERNISDAGLSPGTEYAGGTQTGPSGQGRAAEKYKNKLARLFDGIDLDKCGPLANPDCAELLSRLLEQTFRNFQLTARPPSHVEPPYPSVPIDVFSPAGGVLLLAGGIFVDVCAFVMPAGLFRGEIKTAEQCLESAFAFTDVVWQIAVDGQAYAPWTPFSAQLWPGPMTPLAAPIHLQGQQRVAIQARAVLADHTADARLTGWNYLMRSNTGGLVASGTIVD